MKIKNNKPNRVYVGFRSVRPGYHLDPNQSTPDLPATVGLEPSVQKAAQSGAIVVILTDGDRRVLGDEAKKLQPVEAKPAPAPEKEKEEVPTLGETPSPEVKTEEPVVEEPVAEEPVVVEEPEAEEEPKAEEPEEDGFELPKPPSKMTKADWLGVGMLEEVGLRNEIDMSMTKAKLQEAVMARLEELGLID